MSSCSCGAKGNIPKPMEKKKYASVTTAYDTIKKPFSNKKKFSSFEIFLIIVIFFILFKMINNYKC
jgi:hypothetical protein